MELTSVGFYKEMPHGGDSKLSILDFVNKTKGNTDKIVSHSQPTSFFKHFSNQRNLVISAL